MKKFNNGLAVTWNNVYDGWVVTGPYEVTMKLLKEEVLYYDLPWKIYSIQNLMEFERLIGRLPEDE